jgi:hypothetical protein
VDCRDRLRSGGSGPPRLELGAINWEAVRWAGAKNVDDLGFAVLFTAAGPTYGTVGALVASRRPGNRIGWLCLALGLLLALGTVAEQYA